MRPSTLIPMYPPTVAQPTTSPVMNASTAGGSTAASYTNPVTSANGEYMVLEAHRCFTTAGASDTIASVTDARGNAWTRIGSRQVDGTSHQTMEIWGARNNGATGTFNITINWNSAGDRGSSVASSYGNVNTSSPTGGVAPVFSVNDTSVASVPSVAASGPFNHCRVVAAFGSTEDLAGNTPDNITGYGAWESVNSSFSGTGTTASKVTVSDVDDQSTSGAVTVKDSSDSMRFYIWGAFFLKGT